MRFVRLIPGHNHLWAVKSPDEEADELTLLFRKWNNAEYLMDFFIENFEDLKGYFKVERIDQAVEDTLEDAEVLEELILEFPYTNHLDELFRPLDITDTRLSELSRWKARNWERDSHASWLRVYAIRLEPNVYIITGGAIKLSRTMQEREHTARELLKIDRCKRFLRDNGVFDRDSFLDLTIEYN